MTRTRHIAQAGVIAAVYAALTIVVVQLGTVFTWGPLQFRPSEAVTVVAAFTPAAIPGLWLGAVVANAYGMTQTGALGLLDVVFGGLGTLLGAAWTWRFRRSTPLALLGPVIANALIVPAYLPFILATVGGLGLYSAFGIDASRAYVTMYLLGVLLIGAAEALVIYTLGWLLLTALRRVRLPWLIESRATADEGDVRHG